MQVCRMELEPSIAAAFMPKLAAALGQVWS
jgi:hypothetical protein